MLRETSRICTAKPRAGWSDGAVACMLTHVFTNRSCEGTNMTPSRSLGLVAGITLLALAATPRVVHVQGGPPAAPATAGGGQAGAGQGGGGRGRGGGGVSFAPPTTLTRYDDYTG